MHSPGYLVTLTLQNIAKVKISGYHPDGKIKFLCKFQFSRRGGTGLENTECAFEPFSYRMYGKQLKIADFRIMGQIRSNE